MGNSLEAGWLCIDVTTTGLGRHETAKEASYSSIIDRRRALQSVSSALLVSPVSPTVHLRVPSVDLIGIVHLLRGSLFIGVRRAVCTALRTSCTGSCTNGSIKALLPPPSRPFRARIPAPHPPALCTANK